MLRRRSAAPAPQATPKGGSSQYAVERILRIPDARAVLAGTAETSRIPFPARIPHCTLNTSTFHTGAEFAHRTGYKGVIERRLCLLVRLDPVTGVDRVCAARFVLHAVPLQFLDGLHFLCTCTEPLKLRLFQDGLNFL